MLTPATVLSFLLAITSLPAFAADGPRSREHLSLDSNWAFHLGDEWSDALPLDKEGASTGPARDKLFSDATWHQLDLPGDWVDVVGRAVPARWSPSLFNGLAHVIVRPTRDAGDIRLTASVDALATATITAHSHPATPRPSAQ